MLAKHDGSDTVHRAEERYAAFGLALGFALAAGLWLYILVWL